MSIGPVDDSGACETEGITCEYHLEPPYQANQKCFCTRASGDRQLWNCHSYSSRDELEFAEPPATLDFERLVGELTDEEREIWCDWYSRVDPNYPDANHPAADRPVIDGYTDGAACMYNTLFCRAYGMQRRASESLVAGVAALLVLACRGSEGTAPESPQGSAGTHSVGIATTPDTTDAGATTSTVHPAAPGRIVVLGSSTAAGRNASSPDQAWVARYQAYLADEFPNFTIDNLAMGGFNTYQIQASDYVPPAGRPAPIRGHNISAALENDPEGVIINLPSNDEDAGFSLDEQMDNYERVVQLAQANGVLVWVATPQPRNFAEAEQRQGLMATRDAIHERFAPRAIDFWTDLANPDGTMESNYDSGDGTHFNDAGHAILAQRVITSAIPEVISSSGN